MGELSPVFNVITFPLIEYLLVFGLSTSFKGNSEKRIKK
jgi:hypothetical protein